MLIKFKAKIKLTTDKWLDYLIICFVKLKVKLHNLERVHKDENIFTLFEPLFWELWEKCWFLWGPFRWVRRKINNILNWFYSNNGYYSLKSGFYMDHYFKSFFHKIFKEIVLYSGIIFMDKFFLNKLINNITISIYSVKEKIINLKQKNNLTNIKKLIIVISIIIIILLFYIF